MKKKRTPKKKEEKTIKLTFLFTNIMDLKRVVEGIEKKSTPKKNIEIVCRECGISANVLTCLNKYGKPPKKLAFDVSTFYKDKCDYCGDLKYVTQVRDFFYPDFSLLPDMDSSNRMASKLNSGYSN